MQNNRAGEPLKLLIIAAVLLFAFSYVHIEKEFMGLNLHTVDLFSDLTKEAESDEEFNYDDEYFEMQDDFFNTDDSTESNDSSLDYDAMKDNVNLGGFGFDELFNKIDDDFYFFAPTPVGKDEPIRGNLSQLKHFFNELKNSKSKVVRIAHYGDSAIEGDLITADIRQEFQRKFGGEGVGFLGLTSQDTKFRETTSQRFSNNWETAAIYSSNPKNLPVGVSGEIFIPQGDSWVEFETNRKYRTVKNFTKFRLFYSHAKSSEVKYTVDGNNSGTIKLRSGNGIQEAVVEIGKNSSKLRLEFSSDQAYFYGASLEGGNGVYMDNLPLRGNSGVDLRNIPSDVLSDFAKYLDYDLIILEFGLNAAGSITSKYDWYEREMVQVVKHLQAAFPKASILMISAHDKSVRKGSQFVTDPAVVKLLKSQMMIAKDANVAFWNLFEAMGGLNAMPKWVDANPPLAFKDYIHFNGQGAEKVANMLFEALMDAGK